MTRLSEALFAVWDVETTGLSPADDAVVEVGRGAGVVVRPWTELTLAELQAIATHEDLDPDARHSLAHYRGEVEG